MTFTILSVCTGNICRSPAAELILRRSLAQIPAVNVYSAGVGALVGYPMPSQAQTLMRELDLDPSSHSARQLSAQDLREADLVLTMARDHRRAAAELVPASMRKTFTVRELARIADAIGSSVVERVNASGATDTSERLRAAINVAASMRGLTPPPDDPIELDVVDPYGRSDETYRRSFDEVVPAAERVAKFLYDATRN